jgi:hypothetical protein
MKAASVNAYAACHVEDVLLAAVFLLFSTATTSTSSTVDTRRMFCGANMHSRVPDYFSPGCLRGC